MIFNRFNRYLLILSGAVILTAGTSVSTLAHSGHKHEEKVQVSLPEVVAKVNGIEIKNTPILKELRKAIKNYKEKGMPLSVDQEKTAAKKLIEDEIGRTLLLQKGKKLGLNVSDDAVQEKLNVVKSKFKSDSIFEHELADRGMTVEEYREALKKDLSMERVIQAEVESKISISEQATKDYYQANKDRFGSPEKVRASVILLKYNSRDPAQETLAREKLQSILDQIKGGADFASMAKRFSQDSLASKGGDLGYFTRKQMLAAFSQRAFAMKTGEVSEIFKTNLGLHILKVTDRKPGGTRPYSEVKSSIEKILRDREVGKATQNYISALKKQADIKTYF